VALQDLVYTAHCAQQLGPQNRLVDLVVLVPGDTPSRLTPEEQREHWLEALLHGALGPEMPHLCGLSHVQAIDVAKGPSPQPGRLRQSRK
jgi:hypothetical protein